MVTTQIPSAIGEPVSDPRDDDEPVSIEADAPEADWIEQHQPIIDEDDGDVAAYTTEARGDVDAVSIESDRPEADWIEQHQPIVEAPDEEPAGSRGVPARRKQHVNDLTVLVDRPVDVAPHAVDLDIGLVEVPSVTG